MFNLDSAICFFDTKKREAELVLSDRRFYDETPTDVFYDAVVELNRQKDWNGQVSEWLRELKELREEKENDAYRTA